MHGSFEATDCAQIQFVCATTIECDRNIHI